MQDGSVAPSARKADGLGSRVRVVLAACALVLCAFGQAVAQVLINELLASNRFTSFDEDGDSSDWVELYNAGDLPVRLEGFHLSDDGAVASKWTFPDVSVPPKGYMIVWLSGKDRFVPPPEAIAAGEDLAFEAKFIQAVSDWRYVVADPAAPGPPIGWNRRGFNDAAWPVGRAGFGYGDGDDATILPDNTEAVFTRRVFEVPDPSLVENLVLRINYDDGFVAYLNGARVAAANAPAGDPDFSSRATGKHEAGSPERYDLTAFIDRLVPGENVLAVVGLNDTPSSDMSLQAELGVVPLILHAGFRLDKEGETLLLGNPGGELVDAISYPPQTQDHSYGRLDVGSVWRFFLTPSPGAENDGLSFDEPISDHVDFDPPAGRHDGAILVEISSTLSGVTRIRYTTDGSKPTPRSALYTGPIPVDDNTVIRAAGFIEGERSTRIVSQSYFIDAEHSLPVMSLSMDPDDYRRVHEDAGARGRASEREAFLEYFEPSGDRVVSTGMGLRLHGGAGRGGDFETKKAYKVYFRGIYGDKRLRYPLIPETPVAEFDKLVLRSGFNDSFRTNGRATYLRDELIRDLHQDMGALAGHGTWCMLYVNMKFRGLFNVVERMDEVFMASYLGGEEEEWDVIKTGNDVLAGSRAEWDRLRSFAVGNDLRIPALYERFLEMIDIENYTSYMILNMWAQNHDWPHNNWYAARRRAPGEKWIFLSWDAEFGVGLIPTGYEADSLEFTIGRNGNLRDILVNLLENEEYRAYFVRELDRHLRTALDRDNVLSRIGQLRAIVQPDIQDELDLFGRSLNNWIGNVNAMNTFAVNRGDIFFDHVIGSARYDFPDVSVPVVSSVDPPVVVNMGEVDLLLRGSRFAAGMGLEFEGLPGEDVRIISSERLTVRLPFDARLEGTVRIFATNPESGERGIYDNLLRVLPPIPRVETVTPAEGSVAGGEEVLISGRNFTEDVQVFFGDAASPRVTRVPGNETSRLLAISPPGSGSVEVRAVNVLPREILSSENAVFTYEGELFLRGDTNGDARVDISDGVRVLGSMFLGQEPLACKAAGDANGSGAVDISDALTIFGFLFQGSATLPMPFPECGTDPTTALSCEEGGCF